MKAGRSLDVALIRPQNPKKFAGLDNDEIERNKMRLNE